MVSGAVPSVFTPSATHVETLDDVSLPRRVATDRPRAVWFGHPARWFGDLQRLRAFPERGAPVRPRSGRVDSAYLRGRIRRPRDSELATDVNVGRIVAEVGPVAR
jgi:hypothetical protein